MKDLRYVLDLLKHESTSLFIYVPPYRLLISSRVPGGCMASEVVDGWKFERPYRWSLYCIPTGSISYVACS